MSRINWNILWKDRILTLGAQQEQVINKDSNLMSKRFDVLDSFRGLAALSIIILHLNYTHSITEYNFFQNSALMVDFFFILSGFVLTHSFYLKSRTNFKDYFIARTFRIFPLHLFMLLVMIIITILKWIVWKYYGINFNHIPFEGQTAFSEIIPNMLLLQSWLPNVNHFSFNAPSWSISVEYYIYMVFYMTLYLSSKIRTIIWILLASVVFLLYINDIDAIHDILRGISGFFSGVLVYFVYKNIHQFIARFKKIYFILIEILLMSIVFYYISTSDVQNVFYTIIIFSLVVFIFSFQNGVISNFLRLKLFTHIGKLSYSIYLIHYSLLFINTAFVIILGKVLHTSFTFNINGSRYIDFGNTFFNNFAVAVIILVVILLSSLTYKYVEKVGLNLGKKLIAKGSK